MRKSKTGLRKKEKVGKHGDHEDSIESSVYKEKGLFSKDVNQDILPSFEVLEVSKGAQRLNLMIDSWSKGVGFDGNESKDIARDLLKSALDLQESLVMLCNLQETSKHFGEMKKEHNQRYKGGVLDDADVERSDSDRFTDRYDFSRMQPAGVSLDGSTRSSVAELKKVIRESLARQNLLSVEDDAYFIPHRRKLDAFSDIPSTSSSQSSTAQSNNSTSMDWSVSSTSKDMKGKSSNVIAKLMGLEDFPSQTSPSRIKQPDNKKLLVHRRLVTDIEMPHVRNVYPVSRNKDPHRKTLKEVIHTMHLKGLLKDNGVEGLALHSHNPSYSLPKDNDEIPPIVLIKPLQFSRKEKRSFHSFRKLEAGEESSSDEMCSQGEGALGTEETHNKVEARREQHTDTHIHINKALKLKSVSAKVEPKEKPIRRLIQQERNSNSKESKRQQEVREQKVRGKASANTVQLGSVVLTHKAEEKGVRFKRSDEVKKVLSNRKIPEQKRIEKPITMPRSSSQDATTYGKSRKIYSSQVITKDLLQRQGSPAKNPIPVRSRQSKVENPPGQAKSNATRITKPAKESMKTIPVSKRSQSKLHNKESNQKDGVVSVSTVFRSDPQDHQPRVEDTKTTKPRIEDQGEAQLSSLFEVGTVNRQQGSIPESTEELTELLDRESRTEETEKNKCNLKALLLSNSSFLERAECLFKFHTNQPVILQASFSEDDTTFDTRLALDCANELLEFKSHRISPAGHSLFWIHTMEPRTSISLDQLLGEVCQDFAKLADHTKVSNDIYKIVECDIRCKGKPNGGAWEFAWENGFSVKEADQVFDELEKQVLSELIEEIIVEYSGTVVQCLW